MLTSDFKVHGTEGLRVVDASVFPRVPGLFIVSAVYMIGEKAADVIIAAAHSSARDLTRQFSPRVGASAGTRRPRESARTPAGHGRRAD